MAYNCQRILSPSNDNKDGFPLEKPQDRGLLQDSSLQSRLISKSVDSLTHRSPSTARNSENAPLLASSTESRQPLENTDRVTGDIAPNNNENNINEVLRRRGQHVVGNVQHQWRESHEATTAVEVEYNEDEFLVHEEGQWFFDNARRRHRMILLVGLILFGFSLLILGISYHYFTEAEHLSAPSNAVQEWNYAALKELKDASLEGLSNGAVASDHPICSRVGLDILQEEEGNAVDAAVATVLCLGVANPASSGLGGGAFLLVRSSRKQFEENQNRTFSKTHDFFDARELPHRETESIPNDDPNFITEVIDCRETAPERSSRDMYTGLERRASFWGGLAIPVPGELRGLELAHSRHGRLPWSKVVEPARLLAQHGVPVGKHLAEDIKGLFTKYPGYDGLKNEFPAIMRYLSGYNKADRSKTSDDYLQEGEILQNPSLAILLAQVAEGGADALYKGPNAENIVNDVQKAGGILTMKDMEDYRAVLRTPIHADVSGYSLVGVPPPSSGGAVVIAIARFLAGYSMPFAATAGGLSVHRMVEGMRHAFSIRMSLSDPSYKGNVTHDAVDDLTRNEYMESLRKITDDDSTLRLSRYGGQKWAQMNDEDGAKEAKDAHEGDRRRLRNRKLARRFGYLEDNGTSHLSVVDKDGNSVAITTSVNNIFGSLVFSESTGVLLGNTMDDFGNPGASNVYGLKPSEANFIVPGKRPLSSMSPMMVFRKREGKSNRDSSFDTKWGDLALVLGGSGGPKIISAVIQVLLNVCFLGMPLFDAVTRPRIHDQLVYHDSVVTTTEKATILGEVKNELKSSFSLEVPQRTKDALLKRNHRLLDIDYMGCVQAILVDPENDSLSAVSDVRKGGRPAGY